MARDVAEIQTERIMVILPKLNRVLAVAKLTERLRMPWRVVLRLLVTCEVGTIRLGASVIGLRLTLRLTAESRRRL